MTYEDIENIARELVLSAMRNDERNIEDLDNPKTGSFISNFVEEFYRVEGTMSWSLLVTTLRNKYGVNISI